MEVRECHKANSGRDSFPILIRRQMIPKVVKHLTDLATTTPIGTDLDVAAAKANRNKEEKFYTWKNMNIGTTVNLLGRPFIIYDVDEFTRRFYTEKGWKPESLRRSNIASFEQTKAVVFEHKENKEEVHPRPNLAKLLETQGKQLRFIGQLLHKDDHSLKAPSVPDPKARNFVVCFRLTDEKISIFECLSRNSGFIGGKFCEWTWVKKNGGGFYSGADVYVGAIIEVLIIFSRLSAIGISSSFCIGER